MEPPFLKVAEIFHSFQGEGASIGTNAIFIRLSGCTLDCSWCDTAAVWKAPGITYSPSQLWEYISATYGSSIQRGARLVLTGGSPLKQAKSLALFTSLAKGIQPNEHPSVDFIELETECVLIPSDELSEAIDLFNVSPKLKNSGMPESKRIRPHVIQWHAHWGNRSIFKFVVATEEDVREVELLVETYGLYRDRVWLMPLASTREKHMELNKFVAGTALSHGFNFSPRLHILVHDQATGV